MFKNLHLKNWFWLLIGTFIFYLIGVKTLLGPYSLSKPILFYDEATLITGAKRILNGDIIYKDFWTIYKPFNFLSISLFFKFFGISLESSRIHNILIGYIGILSMFYFLRQKLSPFYSSLISFSTILITSPLKLTHSFLFLSLAKTFKYLEQGLNKKEIYLGGLFTGLAFATRLDFGLALGGLFFVAEILRFNNMKNFIKTNLMYLSGFVSVLLPIYVYIIKNKALSHFWDQTYIYPLFGNYLDHRTIPFPKFWTHINSFGLEYISYNLFWLLPFLILTYLVVIFFRKSFILQKQYILMSFLIVLLSLPYLLHRTDYTHLNFINLIGIPVIARLILPLFKSEKVKILSLLTLMFFILYSPFKTQLKRTFIDENWQLQSYDFYTYPIVKSRENQDFNKVLNYIKENIPSNKKIYIGLTDHSQIFSNNIMLYFMINNPIPTKFHELHTGVVTLTKQQEYILDEIKNVEDIILWESLNCEPNLGCVSSNVHLIDDYITSNFNLVEKVGRYSILKKKVD